MKDRHVYLILKALYWMLMYTANRSNADRLLTVCTLIDTELATYDMKKQQFIERDPLH